MIEIIIGLSLLFISVTHDRPVETCTISRSIDAVCDIRKTRQGNESMRCQTRDGRTFTTTIPRFKT